LWFAILSIRIWVRLLKLSHCESSKIPIENIQVILDFRTAFKSNWKMVHDWWFWGLTFPIYWISYGIVSGNLVAANWSRQTDRGKFDRGANSSRGKLIAGNLITGNLIAGHFDRVDDWSRKYIINYRRSIMYKKRINTNKFFSYIIHTFVCDWKP
jgi:hypothetical protein